MKSEIFHLIILDESGSMQCVQNQTIMGCNETLNTIRSAQEQFADTQDHYVSIYLFQSNPQVPSRYLVKNEPIKNVKDINAELYEPWGGTPLFDAVGSTLSDLKSLTKEKEMAVGNVTIITDGMENASMHYTLQKVAQMIDCLKELGWSFNFIGANIDVEAAAKSLNIDNAMAFEQDEAGVKKMFLHENQSRMQWMKTHSDITRSMEAHSSLSSEETGKLRIIKMRKAAKDYFNLKIKKD